MYSGLTQPANMLQPHRGQQLVFICYGNSTVFTTHCFISSAHKKTHTLLFQDLKQTERWWLSVFLCAYLICSIIINHLPLQHVSFVGDFKELYKKKVVWCDITLQNISLQHFGPRMLFWMRLDNDLLDFNFSIKAICRETERTQDKFQT